MEARIFNRSRDVVPTDLHVGSIVRWRSASNKLTVEKVEGDSITVGWFDDAKTYHTLTKPSIMFVEWTIDDRENYDE